MHAPSDYDRNKRIFLKSTAWALLAGLLSKPGGLRALSGEPKESGDAQPPPWGDPATLVSAIGAGTVAVRSVAETVDAHVRGLEYVEHWRGRITAEIAAFWGVPAMAGRVAAVTGPPGFDRGLFRMVELGDDFKETAYHETLGWVALEVNVRSPDELLTRLEGLPFKHYGGPGDFKGRDGAVIFRAVQYTGPSGEPYYFTRHMALDHLLAAEQNNVGPLFIQTLVAHPYTETRDFYQSILRMKSRMEIDVPRKNVAEAFGLSSEQRYKMAAVRAPDYCSIQIDEYPDVTPQRPAAPGCFPPGAAMCTFTTRDLGAVAGALQEAGLQYSSIEATSVPPFAGSRAVCCRGYSGEYVEFVEV